MIKRVIGFTNPTYLSLKQGQVVVKYPESENSEHLSDAIKAEGVRTLPIWSCSIVNIGHL